MARKGRIAVVLGAAVLLFGYLVASAFGAGTVYYLTVDELLARGAAAGGRPVRVAGFVAPGTVQWRPAELDLRFRLQASQDGGRSVAVEYRGTRPDLLADRVEVIVEGRLRPDGVLEARQVLVKCPSKYEAAPEPR